MLLQLNIKNFALIENTSINLNEGLTVFSGETGSGKSIIIDAINFSLGAKFGKDIIRTGEDKTFVEVIFSLENKELREILENHEIEIDDLLIISRELFLSGRSIIKINGKTVNSFFLKEVRNFLIDIHGQHENQVILNESVHINYLDSYKKYEINKHMYIYKNKYSKLKELDLSIQTIESQDKENKKLVEYLKFVVDDIDKANIKIGEEEELLENVKILSNAEKISKSLSLSYTILKEGRDSNYSAIDELKSVLKEVKSVEEHMHKLKDVSSTLEESVYNIIECCEEIRNIKDSFVYDEAELSNMNERIYLISNYKKKYGESIEEILNYKNECKNKFEQIINSDETISKLKSQREDLIKDLYEVANEIHKIRVKNSIDLEVSIKKELNQLGLEKSIFKIEIVKKEALSSNGLDEVYFLISTNPGEPLKHMNKIVSGGELGRITLALKTVFIENYNVDTVIFDEIDVGISGRIAQTVGDKILQLSKYHQIFCITHLPQIASLSDNHYLVYKEVKNQKTYSKISELNYEGKCTEISKMIGGINITETTLLQAKEMVDLAKKSKI